MSEPHPHPSGELDSEDEDAPRFEPAGLADELFAVNTRETRERLKLSQGELARRMAERGFPYYQQTIRRIEEGRRKVSVGEAKALAEIFETTMDRLTQPGKVASAAELLTMYIVRAERAHQQVGEWTNVLLYSQFHLGANLSRVVKDDYLGSDEIRRLAEEAREALALVPEEAVAEARRNEEEAAAEEEGEEPGDERS